ncbi:MAG TPA: alpha/beta fold hydrolase [Bryobacteraceae bacterium]|nr:alpha/beta fold hydrolase [Bryobacteraceae bacterium]
MPRKISRMRGHEPVPFVVNEGARLFWTEQGSGPPVLLIMGLSFTHEMWYRVIPAIVPHFRAIMFDNRGMGRSDVPRGPYSIAQMARDAAAVLDAAGVTKAHILGASMGGMIAQELAFRNPDRVESLMLACTSYSGLFARWPDLRRLPRPVPWTRASRTERENALIPLLYADGTPRARIEEDFQIRMQCRWTSKGFLNQFAGILLWNSYRWLPRLEVPTLVLHGEQDCLIPVANGKVIAARIPRAELCAIPDAGHILMTDQPEACTAAVARFLEPWLSRVD